MLRVALEPAIDTDAGAMRIVSTHLEFYSEAIRLAQVARPRELHKEACDHARIPAKAEKPSSPFANTARPMSAIVCGDFNSAFEDSAYCRMLEPIPDAPVRRCMDLRAPGRAARRDSRSVRSRAMARRTVRMRFRFHHRGLKLGIAACEVDPNSRSSDHQPMLLELR